MYDIHGFVRGAVEPGVEMLLAHTHPHDRERLGVRLSSVVSNPECVPVSGLRSEYPTLRVEGSVRDVRFHGLVETDEHGAPARWVAVAQGVTDLRVTGTPPSD